MLKSEKLTLELLASISQLFTKKNVMLSLSKHLYRFVE